MLGVFAEFKPKFTKRSANQTEVAVDGIQWYVLEVEQGVFPDERHGDGDAAFEAFDSVVEARKPM